MDIENRRKRIFVRAEEAHEAKSCKTCDFCIKPDMYDTSRWQCKAPENINTVEVDGEKVQVKDKIAGDWCYRFRLCYQARQFDASDRCGRNGIWYQLDPYIPINGKRQVDLYREERKLSTPSERVSLKNLTLKDIL